jgi:ribonucleotide reductase beta subunit family protein with ferritin-like domain
MTEINDMILTEKIQQYVQKLPSSFQVEVLDFVEYLLTKAEQEREWTELSLSFAMRGMEDEDSPTYTTSDLKVTFS